MGPPAALTNCHPYRCARPYSHQSPSREAPTRQSPSRCNRPEPRSLSHQSTFSVQMCNCGQSASNAKTRLVRAVKVRSSDTTLFAIMAWRGNTQTSKTFLGKPQWSFFFSPTRSLSHTIRNVGAYSDAYEGRAACTGQLFSCRHALCHRACTQWRFHPIFDAPFASQCPAPSRV
jgi:hypothetical protein